MDITKAQFADFNNSAGKTTFSYAELLAQLTQDIPPPVTQSPWLGMGAIARATTNPEFPGNASFAFIPWDVVDEDDLGFMDISGTPDFRSAQFRIPDVDPPILACIVGGGINWENSQLGNLRAMDTRFNGNGPSAFFPAGQEVFNGITADATHGNRMMIQSGQQNVDVGDNFWIDVLQDSGVNLSANAARGFIRVVR